MSWLFQLGCRANSSGTRAQSGVNKEAGQRDIETLVSTPHVQSEGQRHNDSSGKSGGRKTKLSAVTSTTSNATATAIGSLQIASTMSTTSSESFVRGQRLMLIILVAMCIVVACVLSTETTMPTQNMSNKERAELR